MRNIKSFIIFSLLLNSLTVFGQIELKNAPGTKFIASNNADTFLISSKPITNREYIIYFLWLSNVYGIDYPAYVTNAIPGIPADKIDLIITETENSSTPFKIIFTYAPTYVKDYIFNPKYIDYPVIGLSKMQANQFCFWLSDRYNEKKLIDNGFFKHNPIQINEDCFVTETYIVDQYYGARIKPETIKWGEGILIPSFRLPTNKELTNAMSCNDIFTDFKAYKYTSTSFLNYWHQLYLKVSENSLKLNYSYKKSELISSPEHEFEISSKNYVELTSEIDEKASGKLIEDFIEIEKDAFGQMPFIILGETSHKVPLIIEKEKLDTTDVINQTIYKLIRFACSIKPNQFKP